MEVQKEVRDFGKSRARDGAAMHPTPTSIDCPFMLINYISGLPSSKGYLPRHSRREAFMPGEPLDSLQAVLDEIGGSEAV